MYEEVDILSKVKKINSLSFNLIHSGINPSEYAMLKTIIKLTKDSQEAYVRVSDLTKTLNITAPSITKTLNALEKKGLISREVEKQNRRNTLVFITEKGAKLKSENDKIVSDFLLKVYDRVGRENIMQFLQLSELIIDAIDDEIKKY